MTKAEKKNALIAQQRSIVETSRAAGNANLTADEQRQWDILQASITALDDVDDPDDTAARAAAADAERQRISDITSVCREFNYDPSAFINDPESTVDTARAAILDSMKKGQLPHGVGVTQDEGDKFRAAASDAILLRSGITLNKPADGANEFRSMSFRSLAIEVLAREGKSEKELRRMTDDDLFLRSFMTPSSAISAIVDTSFNKAFVELWPTVPTTYQHITSKGTLTDFKESKANEYLLGQFGEFEVVKEGGELKADSIDTTKLPKRSLETRGKSYVFTREMFINDDIGFFSKIPGAFVKADKMTIELEVYRALVNNVKFADGKAFFSADHKNLMTTGCAPSVESIELATYVGQQQKDHNDNPILWQPKFIVTGTGYKYAMKTILHSQHLPGTSNNDINPLYGSDLIHIESPVLNQLAAGKEVPWFLGADPIMNVGLQVDYLNGNEMPTSRRSEKVGVLGVQWDVWHDWKVNPIDFRAFIKNPGVTIVNPLNA